MSLTCVVDIWGLSVKHVHVFKNRINKLNQEFKLMIEVLYANTSDNSMSELP